MRDIKEGMGGRVVSSEWLDEATQSYDDHVAAFHRKFGLPSLGDGPPTLLSPEAYRYRCGFLDEELFEFKEAHAAGDLAGALDALVDLAWVAIGTAHYMRAPFDAAWREVRRANMAKALRGPTEAEGKRGRAEVIYKPAGWVPPDVEGVLRRYAALAEITRISEETGQYAAADSEGGER